MALVLYVLFSIEGISLPLVAMSPNSWIWKPCGVLGGRPEMFINMVVGPPINWKKKDGQLTESRLNGMELLQILVLKGYYIPKNRKKKFV